MVRPPATGRVPRPEVSSREERNARIRDVRARVWRYVFDCYEKKKTGDGAKPAPARRRKEPRMKLAPKRAYVPDAEIPPPTPPPSRNSLASRIEKLAFEERDAVRRRDWSAARSVAQERTALQEARHRAAARRLA